MTTAQQLSENIQRQIDCTTQLMAVLDGERRALASREAQAVEEAADKKRELAAQLEGLETRRRHLLSEAGIADTEVFIEQCKTPEGRQLGMRWHELLELVARCREMNLANGTALEELQRMVRHALGILRGQHGQQELYGRAGKPTDDASTVSLGKA